MSGMTDLDRARQRVAIYSDRMAYDRMTDAEYDECVREFEAAKADLAALEASAA